MKSRLFRAALRALPLLLAASAPEGAVSATDSGGVATLYVAPDGDDTGAGDAARPFATLERARDTIREWKQGPGGLPPGGVRVLLREGVHRRESTFALSDEDSGLPGAPVVYMAAPGERAVLFGGVPLDRDGFEPVTDPAVLDRVICPEARRRLLRFDLRAQGITDLGELSPRGFRRGPPLTRTAPPMLYVGGRRMMPARWPNPYDHHPGMLWSGDRQRRGVVARSEILDPGPAIDDADFAERGGTFRVAFDRLALWAQAEEIWLDGVFSRSWEWSVNRVARIDPEQRLITLRYGEVGGIRDVYSGNFFFAKNLLEEIDRPGEYHIDRAAGILYFLPDEGFDGGAPAHLSMLADTMVSVTGARDITFRGLVFDTGRGRAVSVSSGVRIRLERSEIANFAGGGGLLDGADCAVSGCRIREVGGAGFWVGGGDLRTLDPGGNTIEDCEFSHWGWHNRVYTPALGFHGVGHRLRHSLLRHGPHAAVLLHGNDHTVEYNEFHHVCEEFIDMGVIYINTGPRLFERGYAIRRNVFRDIAAAPGSPINVEAVYIDHGSHGGLIEQNLFLRIGHDSRGWAATAIKASGLHTIARHNLFVDCVNAWRHWAVAPPERYLAARAAGLSRYLESFDLDAVPHPERYPELRPFLPGGPEITIEDLWHRFEGNVIWNPAVRRYRPEGILVESRDPELRPVNPLISRGNWISGEDPGFADAAGGDFTLRGDAPVFERIPGFPPFPHSEIGPRGPVGP